MQQRTFEEVRESLRGKVILVANRDRHRQNRTGSGLRTGTDSARSGPARLS